MPSTIYLDIETLPPLDWDDARIDAYVRSKCPATYKKPESIAAWCEENREETWARAALDWRYSRIACIGVLIDDGDTQTSTCIMGGTDDTEERLMLTALEYTIRAAKAWDADVVGHNILAFDIPRLHLTATRLRHVMAAWLHDVSTEHRRRVTDTMHLAFPSRERVSLDDLARACGVEPKSGKGSDVLRMWLEGRFKDIQDYCLHDVTITREIHLALNGAI